MTDALFLFLFFRLLYRGDLGDSIVAQEGSGNTNTQEVEKPGLNLPVVVARKEWGEREW